ncbi:hypothetical protein B0T10DRAFT_400772 [Thelonectria olida]|uniref:Zn(2)-C6 fungal-type domain-containing protein n=1 Tax=Thelonectria olida TaxID=1576542 RepID=A0A9P9AS33_9HYPO|nr:hypothetical protein B0T10DRAFT_400772 [Thelonectria olida]
MSPAVFTAERACHYCWIRKQRCDKLLPQCSRCCSKFVRCKYDDLDRAISSKFTGPTSADLLIRRDPCGFDISPSGERQLLWAACDYESRTAEGETCPRLVRSILEASGTWPHELTNTYFAYMHPWFPILNPGEIHAGVHSFGTSGEPYYQALAVVFLGMSLLNHPTCNHPNHPAGSGLYRTTRRLFLMLQLPTREKLVLLYAGLLVAAYECGHGMSEQAYATLATCIGMVQQLSASDAPLVGHQFQDKLNLCWCSIVLLDRTIALSNPGARLPMLVHGCQFSPSVDFLKTLIIPDENLMDLVDRFRARAKSALLIGDKLSAVSDNTSFADIAAAEAVLHNLVREHAKQSREASYPSCEGISMALSAVVSMYKTTKRQNNLGENPKLALDIRFAYNIVFDMCRVEGSLIRSRGPRTQCVWFTGLACLYHAAIELNDVYLDGLLSEDFDQLRENLRAFGSYWGIGGEYLIECLSLSR